MSPSPSLYLSSGICQDADDARIPSIEVMHLCERYTLVPRTLFEAGQAPRYLEMNDPAPDSLVFTEGVEGSDAEVVFSVPVACHSLWVSRADHLTWTSHIGALCASLIGLSRQGETPVLGVFVRHGMVDVILAESARLKVCNTFPVLGPADILFFALKVSLAHSSVPAPVVYYMAETPELTIQAHQILATKFRRLSLWKTADDLPLFNLLPPCE
jgi:hypothetical protein